MELKLYDTLAREKRVFRPLDPQNVRMYVCGPTVYDFAHIGNARPVIVFDVLFRLLRHLYGEKHVTYVRNITDVDDKINARAAEEYPDLPLNEAIRKVTEKTDKQFHEDVAALGCLPPTFEPRATEHIGEMTNGQGQPSVCLGKGFQTDRAERLLTSVSVQLYRILETGRSQKNDQATNRPGRSGCAFRIGSRFGRSGGGLVGVRRDDPELDLGVDVLAEVKLDRVEAQFLERALRS